MRGFTCTDGEAQGSFDRKTLADVKNLPLPEKPAMTEQKIFAISGAWKNRRVLSNALLILAVFAVTAASASADATDAGLQRPDSALAGSRPAGRESEAVPSNGGQRLADAPAPLTRFVEDLPETWSRHANELWASSEIQRAAPGSPASSFTLSLPDGTKVPKRIVSLTPGLTETLFALGVQSRIVGVSEYCDYPPEAAGIARVGSFLSPIVEAVVALEPDLVLTSPSPGNKNSVGALERAGINVVVVTEGSASVADVKKSILEVSDLVGRPLEGKAIVGSIESELALVRKRVAGKTRPATAVVVGHDPLVLAGPDSYLGELVNNGGGRNIADELGGKWPRTSWEYVVSEAPEVVIDLSMGSEADTGAAMAIWSRYPDVPAVGKGRVHTNGGFLLLHPGPRTDEQAVLVARYLHPAAWSDSN